MTRTIKEFSSQLAEKLLVEESYGDVAILAGDYVLTPNAEYAKNYGIYPESSLEIASNVIREVRNHTRNRIFMFTLTNDWKFLVGNPRAAEIRQAHWSNPEFDLRGRLDPELIRYLLPGSIISPPGSDTDISLGRYSEQRLHNRYSHLLRGGNRQEQVDQLFAEIGLASTDRCESQSCSLDKCASEIVMILRDLYRMKIRRFIGLLPAECTNNIEIGTKVFSEGRSIFIPEFKEPMLVDNHFLNCTGPQTEEELFQANVKQRVSRHLIK